MSSSVDIPAALSSAPVIAIAREALAGSSAWVVGGALRDAALGREVIDVDLAVQEGAEESSARAIAAAAGGFAFSLSERFATWRVSSHESDWQLDLAPLRGGSIEADLGTRDFTINAMGLVLADAGDPSAELLDPFSGLADLDLGMLRAVSARSFADDPLRITRAARFGASLELEIDARTVELARDDASRCADPAGERVFAELRAIMLGPRPLLGLEILEQVGASPVLMPELDQLRGITQTPYHHLDAHGHSLEVLQRYIELQADLSAVLGDELADEVAGSLERPLADEMTRGGALRFAALLHDIGKSATRTITAEGRVSFMGHDRVGADMTREICARLRTSRRFADFLASTTLNHLRLGFLVHHQPLSRRSVFEYLRATEPEAVDVTVLTVADRLATHGGRTKPEAIEAHLALAREMLVDALAWERTGPPRPPIRGDELASELGIEPGPTLGRLLGEIEAAVYAGEVSSRAEAVELAASRVAAD